MKYYAMVVVSSLASNAMHLHSYMSFTLSCEKQSELGMKVHCIGGQRGSHHCSVRLPALFLEFLQVHTYHAWKFVQKLFPLYSY